MHRELCERRPQDLYVMPILRGVHQFNSIDEGTKHLIVPKDAARNHNDVIKWKHFPRYWSFVRGIHRSPVNSPHKGQWRGTLMFSLICRPINCWVNNREAGDLRHHRAHYDVIVMSSVIKEWRPSSQNWSTFIIAKKCVWFQWRLSVPSHLQTKIYTVPAQTMRLKRW